VVAICYTARDTPRVSSPESMSGGIATVGSSLPGATAAVGSSDSVNGGGNESHGPNGMRVSSDEAFAIAQRLHLAGDLDAAARMYRDIIAVERNHAGALHYLGVLAHQQNRNNEAASLIEAALAASPGDAGALSNLANVCRAQGKLVEALVYARVALALSPDSSRLN
jgi:Flp pilus assembly protein TadD